MPRFWIVNTCIPGETEPYWPSLFATEADAEAYAEKMLRDEWEDNAPKDDDGNPLPYPGNWRDAQDAIVASDEDNLWGQWEITPHDLPDAPAPADPVKAEMLAALYASDKAHAALIHWARAIPAHLRPPKNIEYAARSASRSIEVAIARAEGRA